MRAISALPGHVANIESVALDVDGTLAGADHRVSERTVDVLRRLREAGVVPILVTGRTERSTLALSRRAGMTAPFVSCNGGLVTDPADGRRLFAVRLEMDEVRHVVDFAHERAVEPVIWIPDAIVAERPSPTTDLLAVVNDEPVAIRPEAPVNGAVKVMIGGTPAALDALAGDVAREVPWMRRSMPQFYESSTPGATKREGLRLVLDRLGIPPHRCLGIGDGDTDAEWLADLGLPVVPSNAMPSARAVAALEIGHHADEAVADFLETFFGL